MVLIEMKKAAILFLCLLMVSITACGNENNNSSTAVYRKITADEAYQMMQDTDKFTLLDVRTVEEFEERHIEGAVLIPDFEINDRAAEELPDKNALILIYCRTGRRSANVANILVEMGYTNIYDFGGINDWSYN